MDDAPFPVDWSPLLAWLDGLPTEPDMGGWVDSQDTGAQGMMPWARLGEDGEAFLTALQQSGAPYVFDWPAWMAHGRQGLLDDPTAISTLDRDDCRRLFTVIIRGDRFTEGLLLDVLQNGTVAHILGRVATLLHDPDA